MLEGRKEKSWFYSEVLPDREGRRGVQISTRGTVKE